jgi:DNA replication protein DnaC
MTQPVEDKRCDLRSKLVHCCKRLKLQSSLVDHCYALESEKLPTQLLKLFQEELEGRHLRRTNRYIQQAHFDGPTRLHECDWEGIKIPSSIAIEDMVQGTYIPRCENLILYGPVGTGKTYMAKALGMHACAQGYRTYFYRTVTLMNRLCEARKEGRLLPFLRTLNKASLLILDEFGFVPADREGSQLLFEVISSCYEKRSIILTTNLEFSKWVQIFQDEQLTSAMIDRIIHYSHLLIFVKESYRMKFSLMKEENSPPY